MKNLKIVLNRLSKDYKITVIDRENVVYRKFDNFGDIYEIEVSGIDNYRKKPNCLVFIWKNNRTIYRSEKIRNIDDIISLIEEISENILEKVELQCMLRT